MVYNRSVDLVVLIAWSIWFPIPVYWMPVHAFVGVFRRFGRTAYLWAAPVWFASFWAFLGHGHFWLAVRFPRTALIIVAGFALFGLEVFITSRVESLFGLNRIIGRHELEPERFAPKLMREGLFRYIRHPRYLGAMCALFGLALLAGSLRLLLAAICSIPLYMLLAELEERELKARFGAEFEAYRREVPRFIPRLTRKPGPRRPPRD